MKFVIEKCNLPEFSYERSREGEPVGNRLTPAIDDRLSVFHAQHARLPDPVIPAALSRPHFADASKAIADLEKEASFLVPLGVLGPFSQWLRWPDWLRDDTNLIGTGRLPQRLTIGDDLIVTANILDRGYGPLMIQNALCTDRLITGPTASVIIRNAPTLGEGLAKLVSLINATNAGIALAISGSSDRVRIGIKAKVRLGRIFDFVAVFRLILILRAVERFLQRDMNAVRVQFTHPSHDGIQSLFEEVTRDVLMGAACNRITFPAEWLALRNPDHDPSLWNVAMHRLDAINVNFRDRDLVHRMRDRIAHELASNGSVPRLKQIAAAEGVTERTLGRKLAQVGIQFHTIVEEERRRVIDQLMADLSVPLGIIGERTGFSNASSFGRTFRKWYGCSPGQYRKANTQQI